jgi:hypothetical protein
MRNTLITILTDNSVRSDAAVKGALIRHVKVASPWFNKAAD